MCFFGKCKDHNSGMKNGNETNDPIFFIYFFHSNCKNSFLYLKIVKIHFDFLPYDAFWSEKYLKFGQKLPIWTAYYTFLETRHPKVTKHLLYFVLKGSQKKVLLAHGLLHF